MIGIRMKGLLTTAALVLSAGAAVSVWAQPGPYVEIRTYRDNQGQIVGVDYISRGCADPQPSGWGVTTGSYTVDRGRCFVIAPGPGGPLN